MATQSAVTAAATKAAIAQAAYRAYETKDRAALEAIIADDFHFTSPLDNRIDRATYFRRCWPNSEWIAGFDFIDVVTDGDRVSVTYEARKTDGGRFRNTEVLTIRDHQTSRCTLAGRCRTRRPWVDLSIRRRSRPDTDVRGRLRRSTQSSNCRVRRRGHGACTRRKDRRGLELFRLPIDVSADRVGQQSADAVTL